MSALAGFHPAVADWFAGAFEQATPPQRDGWPSISRGQHTLIAAPTGSGKTLAAFLSAIDQLVRIGIDGELEDQVYVVYVSPLKALSNDIERNLQKPLDGIAAELDKRGLPAVPIRTFVRTGDTPASKRTAIVKRPPHIFVTTPESLYILLTSQSGRRMLKSTRTIIVDEIHALVGNKRGSHLSLSLERLEALVEDRELVRIGLSATQNPIKEVARFLVGAANVVDGEPACNIVDGGHAQALDLAIEVPSSPIETVMSGEVWQEIYDRLAGLIEQHRTTLVFVNTRRMAERLTRDLSERVGADLITSHHGSLARKHRLDAERRLKSGELRCLVATASLELGIDVGDVDLVCQLGTTRTISALVQRVGRSGHFFGGKPKGRLFPLSRDELVEATALVDAVRRGELDKLCIPAEPLDIAAQQMVAALGAGDWQEDALYDMLRRAWPYRALARGDFDALVKMLSEGFNTARGRRSAHVHYDAVNRKLRGRRGARLSAITSGGAIPDNADYQVLLEPAAIRVGSLNEDFAIESMPGDIFQLGNVSYRILRVEPGKVRVEDAQGAPPSIPFWVGEAPSRSHELSLSVTRLRETIGAGLEDGSALRYLTDDVGVSEPAARQVVDYLDAVQRTLGVIPTQKTLVMERFFDEAGGMHLVLHSPFGSRLNRAWGLALRKRFCRSFNFELQAAANEDAIVLSLGPTHSFPLEDVWSFLSASGVREVLVQALLDAPMFATRWRWNATRALAVLRFRGGRKVPPPLLRMNADDLLTVCFPDQVACLENIAGDREVPDHPLVRQTIDDCLHEAMDIDALEDLLRRIDNREVVMLARDLTEPSPLSSEILNARPYAFLDDAPLEERRTQAVMSRRWLDPATASDLGALDVAAIERVQSEAWPEPRDADELHDALVLHGFVTADEGALWQGLFSSLSGEGRATLLCVSPDTRLWVAAERLEQVRAVHAAATVEPALEVPTAFTAKWERSDAVLELVRGRLEAVGPTTAAELAAGLGVDVADADIALAALENEGFVLRGQFRPGQFRSGQFRSGQFRSGQFRSGQFRSGQAQGAGLEWCERRLLARIHRYTLSRLRSEIEPVSSADYMRFLFRWQHVLKDERMAGVEGLAEVLEQLEGYEAAAASWETDLLPSRVVDYEPHWLDQMCLSGRASWGRRTPRETKTGPVRSSPIAWMRRTAMAHWMALARATPDQLSSPSRRVLDFLRDNGASFFDDLLRGTGLLRTQLEEALGELVSAGLANSDGFSGMRALLTPASRARRGGLYSMAAAGRWVALTRSEPGEDIELFARTLLRRWGVVFRRLIDREGTLPPWRDLLRVFRRLESRGDIRGGRFVAGVTGEQYALPEAVTSLRKVRRSKKDGTLVALSAADPLNLVGIITPGRRVSSIASNRILYRDGVPLAVREGGEVRFIEKLDEAGINDGARWDLETALVKRKLPPGVRAYLGNAS